MTTPMLTCDATQAMIPDLLDGTLVPAQRVPFELHLSGCAECRALARDLSQLRDDAASLPTLSPSRDLWPSIESRIATPVVPMNGAPRAAIGRWTVRQFAAAAAVLVAVTAGSTWMVATRSAPLLQSAGVTAPANGRATLVAVADEKGIATYEGEIAKLRNVLQARRGELDSATVTVLEKNLKLIDTAIAESRAALAADPASAFLAGRLNHAYGTKLDLLRAAATLPSRT